MAKKFYNGMNHSNNRKLKSYVSNKKDRENFAKEHTREMIKNYSPEIIASINKSRIYENCDIDSIKGSDTCITPMSVKKTDTVSAIFDSSKENIVILNFASYKNPGGGFIRGSKAQEESLCYSSFLYNVLINFQTRYYDKNITSLNKGLYSNKAIYSEDVYFFSDDKVKAVDVITCSAPNKSNVIRYSSLSEEDNYDALVSRIKFLRYIVDDVLKTKQIEELILGAFGCGVFKQSPEHVSSLFRHYFNDCDVESVVFAVPDKKTFDVFEEAVS